MKKELSPEEKKRLAQKKQQKALKSYKHRTLKNLIIWFVGCMTSIVFLFGSIFVSVKVIPISTYTGGVSNNIVSEEISSKSIIDAFLNIDKYKFEDLPIIETFINELRATEISEGKTIGDLIEVNYEAFKGSKLTDIGTVLENKDNIKVTATIGNTVGTETLGDFGKLSILTEWEEVPEGKEPILDSENKITKNGENFTSNPKLYYYDTTMNFLSKSNGGAQSSDKAYKRAFDDEGKLIAPEGAITHLYYAKLSCVPILELVDIIDESIGRIDLTNLLTSLAGMDLEEDSLVKIIFEGKKISDLDGNAEDLLSSVTFDKLNGEDILGNFGTLPFFTSWERVDDEEVEIIGGEMKNEGNSAIYYYISDTDGEGNPIYSRAFIKDSNVCVDGVNAGTPLYYANLSHIPLLDAVNILGDSFGRVKMAEVLQAFGVDFEEGNIIEKIIGDTTVSGLGSLDPEQIMNDLKIDDLGGADLLGAFGKLSIFNNWEKVTDKPEVSVSNNSIDINQYNPKLYYFIADETDYDIIGGNKVYRNTAYARAFNDDGVSWLGDGSHYAETDLFYANLSYVGFSDMMDLIDDSIMRLEAKELFSEFGMAFESGSIIEEIIGNKTLGELGDITADDIKLSVALGDFDDDEESSSYNKPTYEILLSALGRTWIDDNELKTLANAITISDITHIDPENIALEIVLPKSENQILHSILNDAIVDKGEDGEINIKELSGLNINLVKLSTFMTSVDEKLQRILVEAVPLKNNFADITIGDLSSGLDFNQAKLSAIMDITSDSMLAKILNDVYKNTYGENAYLSVMIEDIVNLDFNNLHLSTVLTTPNEKLQKILVGAVSSKSNFADITLGDLNGTSFNIDGVLLSDIMTIDSNSMLAKILNDAYGNYENVNVGQIASITLDNVKLSTVLTAPNEKLQKILVGAVPAKDNFADITISDLSSGLDFNQVELSAIMDITSDSMLAKILNDAYGNYENVNVGQIATLTLDNVRLSTVLTPTEDNKKLYDILKEMTNKDDQNEIRISDLENFSLDDVKLSTVITEKTNNTIMDKLIEEGATIGTIGTELNNMSLYEVYGKNCFTKNEGDKITDSPIYELVGDSFKITDGAVLPTESNNMYYMHKDDGIWLLLCFETDHEDIVLNGNNAGRPKTFKISTKTIADLENSDSFSTLFEKATIRELIDAGIISSASDKTYTLTFKEIIEISEDVLSMS